MIPEYLNPQLLLALAKITAILVAAFGLSLLIKRPELRASFWIAAILSLPVVFALSFSFSVFEVIPQKREAARQVVPEVTPEVAVASGPMEEQAPLTLLPPASVEEVVLPEPAPELAVVENVSEPSPATPWLFILYVSGVILALIPLLISIVQVVVLKKSLSDGAPSKVWRALSSRLILKAELKFTPSSSAPFASGILKPTILIPDDSAEWNPRRLQSTLLHEAAHLKRRDPLTRLLSSMVKVLFWFHSLVWLAHRRLIAAQEQACDQFALSQGVTPTDYAEDLLHSASLSHTTPTEALAMARWSQLGNRIRHILNFKNHRPTSMKQVITLCSVFIIAALAVTTVGFAMEKEAEAQEEGFLSGDESDALDQIEELRKSFGVKHPKMVAQLSKIPELKIHLAGKGDVSWQLTTGPHLYPEGEIPKELMGLLKSVPDLVVRIHAGERDKFEDLATLMEALRKAGATNVMVAMAEVKKKKWSFGFGKKKATAVVQIHPAVLALGSPSGILMTVRYMENEFEIISAPETFKRAGQLLRLEFPSEKDAVDYFATRVSSSPIRGTDLVAIQAHHKDRATAVAIANAVARVYQKRRAEWYQAQAKTALAALDEALNKQKLLVEKNRKHLTGLIEELGVDPNLAKVSLAYQADLEKLKSAKGIQRVAIARSIKRGGNQVPEYYKVYQAALERADLTLRAGLGERHPEVIKARKHIDRAFKNLEAETEALVGSLEVEVERLKKMKTTSKTSENANQHYLKAKVEYEQSRLMYRQMSVNQQEQRVLLKTPRTPVTIHEIAK